MYATLAQFLRMTPAQQSCVTHLDLSIAEPLDWARYYAQKDADETEAYPGERRDTYGENSR